MFQNSKQNKIRNKLTQNSSKLIMCKIFSIVFILFFAISNVCSSRFLSKFLITDKPFSDIYNSVNLIKQSKFSISRILLLCKLRHTKLLSISKFLIFTILFLPRYKWVNEVNPSKFSIS